MSDLGPPEPSDSTLDYHRQVDARLTQALDDGVRDFGALLVAAEGADPQLVAQQLHRRGHPIEPTTPVATLDRPRWSPELHARDFEWYFTPDCAKALAQRAVAVGPRILCMGTPTVAFALLDHSGLTRLTLVDRNPLVDQRAPASSDRNTPLEMIHADLAAARLDEGRYDLALFDAPWYPTIVQRWLAVAAHAVGPGGRVWFALLPRLHRPQAQLDRALLLADARRLGTVSIEPGVLAYQSPHFEQAALAAAGVEIPESWRRADLVRLTVERPVSLDRLAPIPAQPRWARYTLGSQVVHLDLDAPPEAGEVLSPVDDRADYRYTSISTRDPRSARIGLWTSRSRVAVVRQPQLVAALLERLRELDAQPVLEALEDLELLSPLSPDQRRRLLQSLRTLLAWD